MSSIGNETKMCQESNDRLLSIIERHSPRRERECVTYIVAFLRLRAQKIEGMGAIELLRAADDIEAGKWR